jgi:predicted transcriptional regulator
MRSRIFEEALVYTKLYSALSDDIAKSGVLNPAQNACWAPERALNKENLNAIREVLVLCREPSNRTQIIRQSSLSPEQFGGCVQFMLNRGLLAEAGCEFATTKKGGHMLKLLLKLKGFFGVESIE